MTTDSSNEASSPARTLEVFWTFLALGVTSFGGPVAHLGYFREAFVVRRHWMSEAAYADLVALCQFLPGPASSQVGMAIGLQRAGYLGLLVAWAAFTLPSALLLMAFAFGADSLTRLAGVGWIEGLKAAAVAVVANALLGMARGLTPDRERASIAGAAAVIALVLPGVTGQLAAIGLGALAGWAWLRPTAAAPGEDGRTQEGSRTAAVGFLACFALLLLLLPALASATQGDVVQTIDRFYRAGSLVFGGGHVVLPLLQAEVVTTGWVERDAFLAGYGAAQAVPGPLFSFAAYLGVLQSSGPSGLVGAAIALTAIYLPSALLVMGTLPFWSALRQRKHAQQVLLGVNAGVVGLLAAAFYDPILTSGITSAASMAIAVAAFVALNVWKLPPWAVVVAAGLLGFIVL